MNDLITPEQTSNSEQTGTSVGRFMAERGLLLMKETRDICTIECNYESKIKLSTLALSVMNSSLGKKTFGVRFDQFDGEGQPEGGAFLDFDEIEELVSALAFVDTLAKRIISEKRDYTEITYSTKDEMRFGFYQSENQQQAFVEVGGRGGSAFLPVDKLQDIRIGLTTARAFLVSKGAEV